MLAPRYRATLACMDKNERAAKAAAAAASRAIMALQTIRDIVSGSTIELDSDQETVGALCTRASLEIAKIVRAVG